MSNFWERIKNFLLDRLKQPTTWVGIIALILGLLGKDEVFIRHFTDAFTLIFWGTYASASGQINK